MDLHTAQIVGERVQDGRNLLQEVATFRAERDCTGPEERVTTDAQRQAIWGGLQRHHVVGNGRREFLAHMLVQRLQTARQTLQLPQALAKLDRYDLLILDDISYVRKDQAETSVLFELIAERYERKSIAITANTPFSEWGEVFVDAAMTVAAVDRLVHHSTILEMNVESYRRRTAQDEQAPSKRTRAATTGGEHHRDRRCGRAHRGMVDRSRRARRQRCG